MVMRHDGPGAIALGVASVEVIASGRFDPDQVRVVDEGPGELTVDQSALSSAWESEEALARGRGVQLENNTLLRLASVEVTRSTMTLVVGRTDYREFVGTRTDRLPRDPLRDRRLANPLGSSVVAVTADGYVVVARRPLSTDINPGQLFLVGGFLEPSDLDGGRGVFGGAEREMREELGLGDGMISSLHCTGVVYDQRILHPELCFTATLALDLADLARLRGDGEVHHVEGVAADAESLRSWLTRIGPSIVPTAKACIHLHGQRQFGRQWNLGTATGESRRR